jgi:hypothetical protein
MDDRRRSLLRTTSALLLLSQLAGATPALAATAPAKPAATAAKPAGLVPRAQGYYREARYDEAVGLLAGPVMRKELAGQELIEARLVLARCYVKKGIIPRAKEHFAAILAIDPAYTLDKSRVDADELAVFNEVKGVPAVAAPPAVAAGKPATPEGKTPPAPTAAAQPPLHKPETEAAGAQKQSWFSKNKYLALGILVGTGVAVGVAMGGGGDDTSPPAGPATLQPFPQVPGGH